MSETETDSVPPRFPASSVPSALPQAFPASSGSAPSAIVPSQQSAAFAQELRGFFSRKYKAHKLLYHAAITALVFVVVSLPLIYSYTSRASRVVGTELVNKDCPTSEGKFVHSLLFFVVVFVICKIHNTYALPEDMKSSALMAKHAFYAALIYFFLSSTDAYLLSRKVIPDAADEKGCPSLRGILLHGVVFLAVFLLVSYFPKD